MVNLLIRNERFGKKQKSIDDQVELRIQTLIAMHLTEHVLRTITHCTTSKEMLDTLENLYGSREHDLNQLYSDYQNYRYDNGISALENVNRLEALQSKIHKLGDSISETAFKAKILNILPKRFESLVAACNLDTNLSLKDLRNGLAAEDARLTRNHEIRRERADSSHTKPSSHSAHSTKEGSINACFICHKAGHKAQNCIKNSRNVSSKSENHVSTNQTPAQKEEPCRYCKEPGHRLENCPELERRKNNQCRRCGEKGHYGKNCKNKSDTSFTACIGYFNANIMDSAKRANINRDSWILDGACTAHVSNDLSKFENIEDVEEKLTVGNNQVVDIKKVGNVKAKCNGSNLEFKHVLYNANSPVNLISMIRLLRNNWKVEVFTANEIVLKNQNHVIDAKLNEQDLWSVQSMEIIEPNSSNRCKSNSNVNKLEKTETNSAFLTLYDWHRNFAHTNLKQTEEILRRNNISYSKTNDLTCTACSKGKAIRLPFSHSDSQTKSVGDLVHTDLLISPVESLGKNKYALIIKDDYSNFRVIYFLKQKSETYDCFKDFFNIVNTQTGNRLKRIRTDNGTEEVNNEVNKLCSELGIIHELTCPFSPEQNGRIEREMRTLSEAVGTILIDSGLKKDLWAEAMLYVVFTLNRTAKSREENRTPYETFFGKTAFDVRTLKPFGSKVVIQIPKHQRKKFDPKGEEGFFIGYPSHTKGFKIFFPAQRQIKVSRNVVFLKQELNELNEITDLQPTPNVSETEDETVETIVIEHELDWSDDEDVENELTSAHALINLKAPKSFNELETLTERNRKIWNLAIKRELNSMDKKNVWKLVPNNNYHVIDTKWVFRVKETETGELAKARLVARGFLTNNYDLTYAPVVDITVVRVALAVASARNLNITHVDIETAFLNGELKEDIYLKPPEGLIVENNYILKLNKALYGLKQAPKCWYEKINSVLISMQFKRSKNDNCFYVRNSDLFIILYVDDLLIFSKCDEELRSVISKLEENFELKLLPNTDSFIGLQIQRISSGILISQSKYIEKLCNQYGIEECKQILSPMENKLNLSNVNSEVNKQSVREFQRLLGSLNYVAERSRPDICFSVNKLSRVATTATSEQFKYLIRILKYLNHTKNHCLLYKRSVDNDKLTGYCDASWADDELDRKSTSGFLIYVFGNLVKFKTRKQSIVAQSTAEAEYVALAEIARDLIWVKSLLKDMNIETEVINVYEDNQQCIRIAENRTNYKRSRHIDLKYHFVKDLIEKGILKLTYISSGKQTADILTKSLPIHEHCRLTSQLLFDMNSI